MNYNRISFKLFVSIAVLAAGIFFGCQNIDHQKGGNASTSIPQDDPPPPMAHMNIEQPENPDGESAMTYKQVKTLVHPDGTVESSTVETGTTIGGSQDMADILKEYMEAGKFKGILMMLLLLLCAYRAHVKEWESVAAVFVLGAFASLFFFWWAGLLAFPVAALVVHAYGAGKLALSL